LVEVIKSIHAVFVRDGDWFVARCLDFPVTTQGRTLAVAQKNLQEAVALYLETWGDELRQPRLTEVYLATLAVGA
jgi:predicted RNase H-like HicB family nuclease